MEPIATTTIEHGKAYRFPPLGHSGYIEHAKKLRKDYLDEVKANMAGLPLELAKNAWEKAEEFSRRIQYATLEYKEFAFRTQGIIYALFLSALKEDKSVTTSQIESILDAKTEEATITAIEVLGFSIPKTEEIATA